MNIVKKAGYTLVEALIASSIGIVVVGMATMYLVEDVKMFHKLSVAVELDLDLEVSMAKIRRDLRLSSIGSALMSFYPKDGTHYEALSFPVPVDDNNDGLLDRDADDNIIWNETIIYHIQPGTPDKMIRTVFSPRDTTASTEDRYEQLVDVVEATTMAQISNAVLSGESCEIEVIFENLVNLRIDAPEAIFDGYNPTEELYGSFNFGSMILDDGVKEVTFTIDGKNDDSSGYKFGIDALRFSTSGSYREGEHYAIESLHPSGDNFERTVVGGTLAAVDMTGISPEYREDAQLLWTASAVSNTLTLEIKNDMWTDTTFESPVPKELDGTVVYMDDTFTSSVPYIADSVVEPDQGLAWDTTAYADGSYTWTVDRWVDQEPGQYWETNSFDHVVILQGHSGTNASGGLMKSGCGLRILFSGDMQPVTSTNKPDWYGGFEIVNAWIAQQAPSGGTNIVSGTQEWLTFNNGNSWASFHEWDTANDSRQHWTDWLYNYEIEETNTYLVGFNFYFPESDGPFDWQSDYSDTYLNVWNPWTVDTLADPYWRSIYTNIYEWAGWVEHPTPGPGNTPPSNYWVDWDTGETNWYGPWMYTNIVTGTNTAWWDPSHQSWLSAWYRSSNEVVSYLQGQPSSEILCLSQVQVLPASNTYFTSGIFDTQQSNPDYELLSWTAYVPSGADVNLSVRAGDSDILSDATNWVRFTGGAYQNDISALPEGRYVQYRAHLQTAGDHTDWPRVRDVSISWDGGSGGLVDLVVEATRGPDYGIISAKVNGQDFVKGITFDMEIYQDTQLGRVTASGEMEIRPLNTDK